MMSTADNVVPFSAALGAHPSAGALRFSPFPGLRPEAIQGLQVSYPGALTQEMRALLQTSCGLTAAKLGTIDFTSRWHSPEPLNVFRPCATLAIDDEGRRWIAETSRLRGLPGPVWCVLPEPAVAIYASDDLGGFLSALDGATRAGRLSNWLRRMDQEARAVWRCRRTLARVSYQSCRQDRGVRGWLAELPLDAYVYDLRVPSPMRGWPCGVAGPDGRMYRCGQLPIFAVSTPPLASRRMQHMAQIAATGEIRCDDPHSWAEEVSLPVEHFQLS